MDRRRVKSRSTLHRGFQTVTGSQISSKDGEEPLSGSSRVSSLRGSQKLSNSEMLRLKTRSVSDILENNDNTEETKTLPKTGPNGNSNTLRRSKRSTASTSNPDNEIIENVSSPVKLSTTKESAASPLGKRVQSLNVIENAEVPPVVAIPQREKLLNKRKRFASRISDTESDHENVPEKNSPLKLSRVDPRLVGQKVENSRLLERNSQFSLRRQSQRESNSSILKKLTSPIKATELQENPVLSEKGTSRNKLEDFFKRSGITLSQNDGPHQLDDEPSVIVKKMICLFSTGRFKADEIVDHWKVYINDETNLKNSLNDVTISSNQQSTNAWSNVSLTRMFLQTPNLQTAVSDHLLRKLNESVLMANSKDDIPWSSLLLQQFRFLEMVVDTDSLTMRLEELLETCPIWFQRELVLFLPDVIIDGQHHAIAVILAKLMEAHVDLTTVILDCLTNLTLGKEYLEELRDEILKMLRNNLEVNRLPAMAKFVLYQCPSIEICEKTLSVLRSLDLQPLIGEKQDEYFTNQMLLVNEMRMSILLSKKMLRAARNVLKRTDEASKPLDLILLLLVYAEISGKKNAEATLKQHVKSGFYKINLLTSLYQDYKEVAKELQLDALHLASNLLKSEDRSHTDFASEWFRYQFVSQSDIPHKQREIIEKIILLMGNNDQTAKGAVGILRRMTENEDEMRYLQAHCNHLRILLEKIDNFDLQEVAALSDLLYALCTSGNPNSEALQDDLFILLQKQLSDAKILTKCKGVLGAAMAIKHLAGKRESCQIAEDLFAKVRTGVKTCPRSQALFYDQIGSVIADTKDIDMIFLKKITNDFKDEFVNTYMTDLNDYRGELVAKFGLNDSESEPQKCVINFADGKHGSVVPALFRLLRICFMRLSDGDLEDINVLLGCPVLAPRDMEVPEISSLDLMICSINWFRELISGFVSQTDPILQEQVLKRLENLMTLQAEFSTQLALSDARYQPPPCYFHVFPPPPFVKVEKKIAKKGKRASSDKTFVVPEWEAWEIGSSLCTKNPTYFRRFDAKVVDLLDLKMDQDITQSPKNISKAQICFLIKELLGMVDGGETSETLVRDLVYLLPKICSKLQDIVTELREQDDVKNRHAVELILSLLTTIFNWKGFRSPKYHSLLRDGLRTLAGQINKSNSMLRSSKELVAESYKYFESLGDVATNISLAFGVVTMCRSLMKHSDTFTRQYKSKQANLASGFLALQWPDDKASGIVYKTSVVGFLTNWIQNEPNPLETVTAVLEWLPDEIPKFDKALDRLERLPAITRTIFHHMFQKLFEGLISGVRISLNEAKTDPERIKVWQVVGRNVQKIVQICKSSQRSVLLPFLRSMTSLLRIYLGSGMPILEQNLRFQTDDVTGIMKMMQCGTRYVNMVCVDCAEKKDITLAKIVPLAKQLIEKLVLRVKGMLVFNNSSDAFWMGNLVNKNLEGQQIFSQSSTDEPTVTTASDVSVAGDSGDDALSEILRSDIDESMEMSDDDL